VIVLQRKIKKALRYLVVALICLACLTPFYILVVLSLNRPTRIFYQGNMFLPDFHFQNYVDAWNKSLIGNAIINSAIITAGTMLLVIIFGSMAGFAIARFPSAYNKAGFAILLGCMMIPGIINTVPLYTLMRNIQAIDTLWGMILVCSSLAIPACVFIYTNFIKALTRAVEEASIVDGCNWFSSFWLITFPMIKPATAAVVVLNGFGIWNNYAQAVFFLQSRKNHNVPLALQIYFQQFAGAKWHLMAATAVIAVIPVIALFLMFQRYFMKGLNAGAVKG
jgi:raffinose/stachyose/melibiose transport system permease protein